MPLEVRPSATRIARPIASRRRMARSPLERGTGLLLTSEAWLLLPSARIGAALTLTWAETRGGELTYRGGLSTWKTVPIGYTDRKSLAVTASAARAVRAGTVQSAEMAHQTAWRLRDRPRPAGRGTGRMAYRFLLEVPESLAEAASMAVERAGDTQVLVIRPSHGWASTIPTSI